MITTTAASAHHPAPTILDDGRTVLNPKFDPAWTVKKTQAHLLDIWEKAASYLDREGVEFFAFRGTEPHLDGTPHHHYGLFYKNADGNRRKVHRAFNWYFKGLDVIAGELGKNKQQAKVTPGQMADIRHHLRKTQRGADTKRVTFVAYDAAKGSLSNYILKSLLNYVIKDVAVGVDAGSAGELTPQQQANQAKQQRVAAWASLHGIKQFTTLRTGASVGIYQELRRIRQPVEGSQQLEKERVACVGSTFGTDDHSDATKRVDADYCAFMEARRNPAEGAEPVKLWKLTETESDHLTIRLNEFSDEVGRIQGVRCLEAPGELLEINTRPLKWRAVNVPHLLDDVVERSMPPTWPGEVVDAEYRESMTGEWRKIISRSREEKTLHQFARGVYHFPLSNAVGKPFRERAQPVTTWKIRFNPLFSPGSGKNAQNGAEGSHAPPTA